MQQLIRCYRPSVRPSVVRLKCIDWGPLAFSALSGADLSRHGAHNFANFGNIDWGLGLPMAVLMVFLAASAELLGGVARYLVWRAACLSFR